MKKNNKILLYSILLISIVIFVYLLASRTYINEPFQSVKNISSVITQAIADIDPGTNIHLYSIDPADWTSGSTFVRVRQDSKVIFSSLTGRGTSGGITSYSSPNFDSLCSSLSGIKNEGGQRWYPPTGYDIYSTCNTTIVADGPDITQAPSSTLTPSACSPLEVKTTLQSSTLKMYLNTATPDTGKNVCKLIFEPYKFRTNLEPTGLTIYGIPQFNSTSDYSFYTLPNTATTGLGSSGKPWMPFFKYVYALKKGCEESGGIFRMETLEQPVCNFSLGANIAVVNPTSVSATTSAATSVATSSAPDTSSSSQSSEKPASTSSSLPISLFASIGGVLLIGGLIMTARFRATTRTQQSY